MNWADAVPAHANAHPNKAAPLVSRPAKGPLAGPVFGKVCGDGGIPMEIPGGWEPAAVLAGYDESVVESEYKGNIAVLAPDRITSKSRLELHSPKPRRSTDL